MGRVIGPDRTEYKKWKGKERRILSVAYEPVYVKESRASCKVNRL